LNKGRPLVILKHGDRAEAELVDSTICSIRLPLENPGVCIVRLLDLANDDGLQFPTRVLEVEICLSASELRRHRQGRRPRLT
jgi:hypothetical protein